MKNQIIKQWLLPLTFMILSSLSHIHAEDLLVDYYGVVSASSDTNMLKMAQDVFFTQLKSIDGISVDDKRPDISKASAVLPQFAPSHTKVAFYAEITDKKGEAGQTVWNCRFNAVTQADGITHSTTENYESYYKILVGAKSAIEKVLSDLKAPAPEFISANKANIAADFNTGVDIESLAGTWSGEPLIIHDHEKIHCLFCPTKPGRCLFCTETEGHPGDFWRSWHYRQERCFCRG